MIFVVLSVIVWFSIPPILSRAMARRGYDATSYVILGALLGPIAILLAGMEALFVTPEPPRVLEVGRAGPGDLSVLVVIGGEPTTSPLITALAGLGSRLGRLGLAQVLPTGGAREGERQAERTLRQAASALAHPASGSGHPEVVLLFGRPDEAIPAYAAAYDYDFVLTARPDPTLSARLAETGRVHCSTSVASPIEKAAA